MFPVLGICVGGRMISSRIKTRNLISLGRLKFGLPSWKLTRKPRNGSGWLRNIMFLQAEPVLEMAVCDLLCKIIMASYHEKLWYSCAVVIVFSIYIYYIHIFHICGTDNHWLIWTIINLPNQLGLPCLQRPACGCDRRPVRSPPASYGSHHRTWKPWQTLKGPRPKNFFDGPMAMAWKLPGKQKRIS